MNENKTDETMMQTKDQTLSSLNTQNELKDILMMSEEELIALAKESFPEPILMSGGKAYIRIIEVDKKYGHEFVKKYGGKYLEHYHGWLYEQLELNKNF